MPLPTSVWSELIEVEVEAMLEDDSYYQRIATYLKSASLLKEEHRKKLREFFEMKELCAQIANAQKLAIDLLPTLVAPKEFVKIKDEIEKSGDHFIRFVETTASDATGRPILFQEMFGFSDDTLLHMYDLAHSLVNKGKYDNAGDLFRLLTILAPHVTSYWIGLGFSLQALDLHEEATTALNAAKFLNPSEPLSRLYLIKSYVVLKEKEKIKTEFTELEQLIQGFEQKEKMAWREELEKYRVVVAT